MNISSHIEASKNNSVVVNETVSLENRLNKKKTKSNRHRRDELLDKELEDDEEEADREKDDKVEDVEDQEDGENSNDDNQVKTKSKNNVTLRQTTSSPSRNHSRSRSNSSMATVAKQQQQLNRKCASCIIWQNIYQVFEFLANGRLLVDEHDYNEMYIGSSSSVKSATNALVEPIVINLNDAASINTSNKYDYLFNLLAKLKFIKNPIDPTECPSTSSSSLHWSWDYKSPKHYKLLKLKIKLLTQIIHLSKLFHINISSTSSSSCTALSTIITGSSNGIAQCKHCLSSLKDKRSVELKNSTIHRLTEYARAHLDELDIEFERYMNVRLENSYDINSLADLNTFMRGQTNSVSNTNGTCYESSNLNDFENNGGDVLKRVEQCSLKIHILLDLLVSENSISKIFKSEAAASTDLNMNSSYGSGSCLENGISRGGSGGNFYRTSKEFSNISNHPYSGRAPLQVQHRNSNDSWPPSPTSMSGVGYDDKLGFSNRHHNNNNHHHSQYNPYHRASSHHQQFNCNYIGSTGASSTRGRVSVGNSVGGGGYYDSVSSKLISNNQNYINGGHYGSLGQPYSSSLAIKNYRYDQNVDAASLSPLRNISGSSSSSMHRRSYGGGGGSYYPSEYSSNGYDYSKYESSSRQRSSTNNIGNYSLNQQPPPRSAYNINNNNGYDLAYSTNSFSQGNGLTNLNVKYGRDYNSKQTYGYSSPPSSYNNNNNNTKSSKYIDDYHNSYQRHRGSSSERSLSRNHYHSVNTANGNHESHHSHAKKSETTPNHHHNTSTNSTSTNHRSQRSSTATKKSSKSRHKNEENGSETNNVAEISTSNTASGGSSKNKLKNKKRKNKRSNSISSLASSSFSLNSLSSPKFSRSSSSSSSSESTSNTDSDVNTSSNYLSDILTSSSETSRSKGNKKSKQAERKRDTKSSKTKNGNRSNIDISTADNSLGSLATKMKSKKLEADRKKRTLETKKRTNNSKSSEPQVKLNESSSIDESQKVEKSKSGSSIKSKNASWSENSSLSINEMRQVKSRSHSPLGNTTMMPNSTDNNEKKRKRVTETQAEKHEHKSKKRNKKASEEKSGISEREDDHNGENVVTSTTDLSLKSQNNSLSLMTEIKKNENHEKNQKISNTSKSSKRSSSSTSSLSSMTKNTLEDVTTSANTSLNKSNETFKQDSLTKPQKISSSSKEHDIEKGSETNINILTQKNKHIVIPENENNINKQEVSIKSNSNEEGIMILVDFELTHADKKSKKSTQRSPTLTNARLDAELESLSQILPVLAYKLTNYNLHEYIEDFERKYLLVDVYTDFIQKLVAQLSSTDDVNSEFKRKLFAMELEKEYVESSEKQVELLDDLNAKVNLVQRLRTECLTRLDIQKKYLTELRNLLIKMNTDIAYFSQKQKSSLSLNLSFDEKTTKNFYLNLIQKLKKNIYRLQVSLVEYARARKQNERYNLVNALPFNLLFNVMDRFMLIYDIV